MAVVSVSTNNTRVEDAESATGWSSIGGGAGGSSEGSFPYQGSNLYNRKITSSTGAGFYYDPSTDGGSAQDMTATAKSTWLVKCIVTDYGGLQGINGVSIRIGSGTTAYYEYVIAGSNAKIVPLEEYPAKGGILIVPINPNISGYRDSTSGSPVLTAVDYFGMVAAFSSSTAKSENVGLDAIDLGTGLTLVGGDGVDTDGTFNDFLSADEGNTANRYGYVTAISGVLYCFGMLTIGTASAAGFTDSDSKVLFLDGYFDSGWSGVTVDLQNASTSVTIANTIDSLGTDTVTDTRADFTVTGNNGSLTLSGTLTNFRNVVLTSGCTVTGDINCKDMTVSTATISGATIRTNSGSGVAVINDLSDTDIDDTLFIQEGLGHAIELTSSGTYTFDNLAFTGYGANGTNSAAIYNNSGGAVTINIINGGDTPTVRNGASASTTVNNTVTVKVTVIDADTKSVVQGARVRLTKVSGGAVVLSGVTDVNGVVEDTGYSYTIDENIEGYVRKGTSTPLYRQSDVSGAITSSGFSSVVQMISDE